MERTFVVRICNLIFRLAALNFYTIWLVLKGGVITGFAPALMALQQASAEPEYRSISELTEQMNKVWKKSFVRSNKKLIPIWAACGLSVYLSWASESVLIALSLALSVMALQGTIAVLWAGPDATFEEIVKLYAQWPLRTLSGAVLYLGAVLFGCYQFPFALYGMFSVPAAMAAKIAPVKYNNSTSNYKAEAVS